MLYEKLSTPAERQAYIAGLDETFETLLHTGQVYLDRRDYQVYDCIFLDNRRWMTEDFRFEVAEGYDATKGQYNWEAATKACPSGWRLPTSRDFHTLLNAACDRLRIPHYVDWVDHYGSHVYPVLKCLASKEQMGFNLSMDSYYSSDYVRYWGANQATFYNCDGQNERSLGLGRANKENYCYLRLVQDWGNNTRRRTKLKTLY